MIEDNYSQLTYIKEGRQSSHYDFLKSRPEKPKKEKKKRGKGFLLAALLLGVFYVGNSALKSVQSLPIATTASLQKAQTANVLASAHSELDAKGSDESGVIIEEKKKPITKNYSLLNASQKPKVGSEAYLVADVESGEVIVSQNADTQYPIASVTKLVTALVARKNLDLHQFAEISQEALATYGTAGELVVGDKLRMTDLMYPMLMESSNDATEVFSEQMSEGSFIDLMNKTAWEIGMEKTSFQDPSGLTPYNISTPRDLFTLSAYIYKNDRSLYDITRVKEFSIFKHKWINKNHFLGYENFIGGKNGYTDEARRTTVSLFEIPVSPTEKRIISLVVLKTENRENDVKAILEYLKQNLIFTK